jgi:putative transposase
VILDAFSRKVVGRGLDRTLAARLPMAALEQAIADRKPRPGVVHHSDRGVQYASGVYIAMLRKHDMIPSMSRPANPYDNARLRELQEDSEAGGDLCQSVPRPRSPP